jgi:TonB family protein
VRWSCPALLLACATPAAPKAPLAELPLEPPPIRAPDLGAMPADPVKPPPSRPAGSVAPGDRETLATYITAMHRRIHEAWAWGFLDALDERSASHPLNDYSLWTRVEVTLRAEDGTIDSVATVRSSGIAAFDEGAREVVLAAAPFGPVPEPLLSHDGEAHLYWALHRDERACGVFGAELFILDGPDAAPPDPEPPVPATRS